MPVLSKRPVIIPKLNFIPKDPFYETAIGKVMLWAIQVGRYIIVFTEIIVIMSFASRFKLDRDLTDLTAKVTQKKAIVASFGDVESRTRDLTKKSVVIDKLVQEVPPTFYLEKISARLPTGVELKQLTYEPTQVTLVGKATSSTAFSQMVVAIMQEKTFSGVALDKIASGNANDPTISFAMRLTLPKRTVIPELVTEKPAAPTQAQESVGDVE